MIECLSLRHFKSASALDVPMQRLTVLSGLNGSGKSSVLQAIALLRQSLLLPQGPQLRALHLRGPLVQLGTASDVLNDHAADNSITIEFRLQNQPASGWKASAQIRDSDILPVEPIGDASAAIETFVCGLHFQFLQADRLTPQTHYDRSDANNRELGFLGAHGQYTPDYLVEHGDTLEVSSNRRCGQSIPGVPRGLMDKIVATPKLYDQVSGWLQHISPGVRLDSTRLSGTDLVALRFAYASTEIAHNSDWRRPANVGFGLTYCLPIVTACLAAPAGSLVLLENPEAHLHPRGQAALGTLLAKCAADGVQIIVETHSDHILNGIRLAAKRKEIEPDEIKICNFTRDTVTGDSYLETPVVLPNGELTAWPDGFFDQWELSLEALLS